MATAEFDETVPPESGYSMARGLGIPQMRPFRTRVEPLPLAEGPLSNNFNGVTAGYFQLDRIHDGETRAAGHNASARRSWAMTGYGMAHSNESARLKAKARMACHCRSP